MSKNKALRMAHQYTRAACEAAIVYLDPETDEYHYVSESVWNMLLDNMQVHPHWLVEKVEYADN